MGKRKLVQSDLEISVLAFGAWAIGGWFWGGPDSKEAVKAIEIAVDNGITTFKDGDSRPSTPYFKELNFSNVLEFIDKIRPIAVERNVTLSQLVLNWTIQRPGITSSLAGAINPAQVMDNIGATDFILTAEEIGRINNLIADVQVDTKI